LDHATENLHHLLVGFAGAVNHLGHAGAQGPVMINLGKAEILVRQIGEARHAFLGRERSVLDSGEHRQEGLRAHEFSFR
jgi:hypothetical protein